jgi:hypothetical protein
VSSALVHDRPRKRAWRLPAVQRQPVSETSAG